MIGRVARAVAVGALLVSCTPVPQEEILGDGEHTGFVRALDDGGLELDLAQLFTGDEAEAAAKEDGEHDDPAGGLPNGIYLRNPDEATVRVPVADADFWLIDATTVDLREVNRSELSGWLAGDIELDWAYGSRERLFASLEVLEGEVVRVAEVYLP